MITKSELIEYLKHTPENTNYNILYSSLYNGQNKEAVDEFIEVLSRGNLSLAALQPYLAKLYEDDKTISPEPLPPFSSGGGSVPKPLTYDYMPEGYPTRTMETVTVMDEQEVAFALNDGDVYMSQLINELEVVIGQTYTVNWDGTEYECVCFYLNSYTAIGNPSIAGAGDDTGEPFLCYYDKKIFKSVFGTLDTSASHTISVKTTDEIVTPMAEEFLPATVAEIKETAENAQTMAENAQTMADNAQTTANAAQTAAAKAKTTAKNAQTTADNALPAYGTSYIRPTKDSSISGTLIKFVGDSSSPSIAIEESNNIRGPRFFASRSTISIGTLSHSSFSHCKLSTSDGDVSKLELTSGNGIQTSLYSNGKIICPNGVDINLIKTGGVILSSSTPDSTKKFKITVDDSGTISATEVT